MLADGHQRLDVLDEVTLARDCVVAWQVATGVEQLLGQTGAVDVLTSWAVWAGRVSAAAPTVDVLEDARRAATSLSPLFHLFWQRLARAYPGDARLVEDARAWLANRAHWENGAWPFVWNALVDTTDRTVRRIGVALSLDWLQVHRKQGSWSWFGVQRSITLYATPTRAIISRVSATSDGTGRRATPRTSNGTGCGNG